MKKHTRTNSKQLPASSSNLFSQKYCLYTKEKKFATPKKSIKLKSQNKQISPSKDILNILNRATTPKSNINNSKININMQIKNLNIFGSQSVGNLHTKKKKLHKKTISCLQNKEVKKKVVQIQNKKVLKHKKTKSQQNLKISPTQWGQLIGQHTKQKKNSQNDNIISKYAYCNRTGVNAEKKEKKNQDTFILIQNFIMKNRYLFGVCDGHGVNGHYVSQFIKQILPENIQFYFIKNNLLHKHNKMLVQSSIRDAFSKTSKDLFRQMQQAGIDIMFSGTTTCLTYIYKNHLYCANLGDSRAVCFSRINETWTPKQVSFDHKAQNQQQANRIKINGGRVFPYYDEDGQQMGPYRVWIKQKNIPGLAMTRSFGDYVASTVGVISQPQILHFQINKDDKFMIVASDGLWQFISNEQVMNMVIPSFVRNDVQQAVQILQRAAVKAWMSQDENIDDITIQVIFFKYY